MSKNSHEFISLVNMEAVKWLVFWCSLYHVFVFLFQRKRSAVSKVKEEAQDILEQGENLLEEANQLSDNINKEVEVQQYI